MHFMTRRAGDLIFRVAALQPAGVGRLIEVTVQANLVGCRRGEFGWIANIRGGNCFGVLLRRSVAGFAGLPFETSLSVRVDNMMRTLGKRVVDVFMASLTGLRPGIRRCRLLCGCGKGGQ